MCLIQVWTVGNSATESKGGGQLLARLMSLPLRACAAAGWPDHTVASAAGFRWNLRSVLCDGCTDLNMMRPKGEFPCGAARWVTSACSDLDALCRDAGEKLGGRRSLEKLYAPHTVVMRSKRSHSCDLICASLLMSSNTLLETIQMCHGARLMPALKPPVDIKETKL